MRRFRTLGALFATLFAVACEEDKTGWDKPYNTTAGLIGVEPGNVGGVDTWNLSCAYLAQSQCGSEATFVAFVGEWGQCWELVDACMAGKDCLVPVARLAGRPLVDLSTGRTRINGILSGGLDGGSNGP